jgi:hypothetical protein
MRKGFRESDSYRRLEAFVIEFKVTLTIGDVTLNKPYDVTTALYIRGVRAGKAGY